MRQLTRRALSMGRIQQGFTLIELMITIAILGVLAMAGIPELASYLGNSKLRESANTVAAAVSLARSEAIKRNSTVSLTVSGSTLTVLRESDSKLLWSGNTPEGVTTTVLTSAGSPATGSKAVFNSQGQLTPFGSALAIATNLSNKACSSDLRCPAVLIEAGGATNVCSKGAANGVCL
jgi:type IV fimbrial biogenesis protein FimT